jgi:hypothetical protein
VFGVCCKVEVCAAGRSLIQRNPTDCVVSECDNEASIMRRSTRAFAPLKKKGKYMLCQDFKMFSAFTFKEMLKKSPKRR